MTSRIIVTALRSCLPGPLRTLARRLLNAVRMLVHGPAAEIGAGECRLEGMTTLEEQRYYEECAAAFSDNDGAIVDLGCWMCSTTIPLARGAYRAAENAAAPADKVYAFDQFIWEKWMDPFLPGLACDYLPGESFLPEARRRSSAWRENIELVQADLSEYAWPGELIKILLVDAMKNVKLMQSITEAFFPYLSEGSLMIHQDFKHYYTSWIHILQYRLRDYFRVHCDVPNGATVGFETLRVISLDVARSASRLEGISDKEVSAAFDYSLGLVSKSGQSNVAAAHAMHFVHAGRARSAQEIIDSYAGLDHPTDSEFPIVAERVLEMHA